MSFEDPATQEHSTLDSGVHVRDTERSPASAWQIGMVAVLVIAILCVFFYGLTSQRQEVAGSTPPPAQASNITSTEQQKQNLGTTGAAPQAENPPGALRHEQPQKTDATPPGTRGGQNAVELPSAPQKNR